MLLVNAHPVYYFSPRDTVCCRVGLHVWLSVFLSVTSRSSIKMAKLSITQTMPMYGDPGTVVFGFQRSWRNFDGITLNWETNVDGLLRKIGDYRPISRCNSETVQ